MMYNWRILYRWTNEHPKFFYFPVISEQLKW
jgi:hypothetical protein